ARAAWSGLVEPGDLVAGALVETLGAVDALDLVAQTAAGKDVALPRAGRDARDRLRRSLAGWAARYDQAGPTRALDWAHGLGARLVLPGQPAWPTALDDLGAARPMCLWVLGTDPADALDRSVAVVGARACTAYGEHVTAELVSGLTDAGVCVVSGGAFGIDAAAHRAALAAEGATVAVLAGGLDRPYPAANARLLAEVARTGALISEVPPGAVPTRHPFLHRSRVIAAAARLTVVVEAAWRSGALNTATHAASLLRPVAAVPGPVTSAASAGCHRLLRDGAVCVTDAAEVLELLDGGLVAAEPDRPVLGADERVVLDALGVRTGSSPEAITRRCGLALPDVLAALGRLEVSGRAVHGSGRWRRA
ncbi:MAG TPA: DNA-processing protein DprA, partial [Actinotalea sp.]|nr:DNA-processing protein DprA [Actinotalea sp.]